MWWWTCGIKVNSIVCKQSMICNNKTLWCESLYSLLTHSLDNYPVLPLTQKPGACWSFFCCCKPRDCQDIYTWHLIFLSCPKHLILRKSQIFWCAVSHPYRPNALLLSKGTCWQDHFPCFRKNRFPDFQELAKWCTEQYHFCLWKNWS